MNRPVGVTLIAVLDFLGMAAQFALGLVFLLGMSFLGSIVSKNLAQNPQFSGVNVMGILAASGVVIAVGFFIFAVIAALLGWGLLKLKNWARIISIIYSSIGILFLSLGVLFSLVRFRPVNFMWDGFWLVVNAAIVWYLLQANVKAAFEGSPRTMAATA